jgi:protein-tyrosine phosphatase
MTQVLFPRVLDTEIPGAINFRDLGGIPVEGGVFRHGLVFRSAMTSRIEPEGIVTMAERFGVRSVIDLRTDDEIQEDGLADFTPAGIRLHSVPVGAETSTTPEERSARMRGLMTGQIPWGEMYSQMAIERGPAYRRFFELVAEEDALSVVFHCAGGRDRTGVAAALLLASLGADDDDIATDYSHTGDLLRPHRHLFVRHAVTAGIPEEEFINMVGATLPGAMHTFLGFLRNEFGSPVGYLHEIGVEEDLLALLRERLVESA